MKEKRPDFRKKEPAYASYLYIYVNPLKNKPIIAEIYNRDKVDRDILQKALDLSLERLPYMADTLIADKGQFYYADNPLPMEVAETSEIRHVGGPETNYHMIDVTCSDNMIRFTAAHEFSDAQGAFYLVDTVLYNYYCIRDGVEYDPGDIRTSRTVMTEAEYVDPYKDLPPNKRGYRPKWDPFGKLAETEEGFIPHNGRKPGIYHISDLRAADGEAYFHNALTIPSDKLMELVKGCKSSPAVVISLMMGEAIMRVNPNPDQMIRAVIPISARRAMACNETFKNCSLRAELPVGGTDMDSMPFAERAEILRGTLLKQLDSEILIPYQRYVIDSFRKLQKSRMSYRLISRLLSRFTSREFDTFFLDYIGRIRTTDYSDKIIRYDLLSRPVGKCPIHMAVLEFNGEFRIECITGDDATRYIEALHEVIKEHGLTSCSEPCRKFTLPDTQWNYGMRI